MEVFYEDYISDFKARIKDLKTCKHIHESRGNLQGVERCNKKIEIVKKEWRELYETALENTLRDNENTSSGGEDCPKDESGERTMESNCMITENVHEEDDNSPSDDAVEENYAEMDEDKVVKECVPRIKKECPLITCDSKVVHLPRHLRTVHGWSKEKAGNALQKFNLRKVKEENVDGKRKRDYHVRKICPLVGCSSIVKRIADHLTKVHKLKTDSIKYKEALKTAKKAPVGEHIFKTKKRQRLERENFVKEVLNPVGEIPEKEDDVDSVPLFGNLSGDDTEDEIVTDEKIQETAEAEQEEITNTDIFNSFKLWLKSPDGGKNDDKTANQHMKQLIKVLNIIDQELQISSLFSYKLLRDKFITEYAEQFYYPKTIKSYIMSVRHFYTYVISDDPAEIEVDKAMLISTRERLQRWSVSYKKECNKHQWEKRESDMERIVTPAMVKEFEKSQAARDAITLIGKLSGASNVEVSQSNYTLVRDFLMAQISIDNANRAGVLANMTVTEFNNAKSSDEGECFVVKVMNHKTLDSKGPANIVLSKKLHSWMSIYLTECRQWVCKDPKYVHFFLSWNGKHLESNQIAKALKSVFKKANMEVQISSNDFRKGAVTEVHENHKDYSNSLAVLLDHNESTANRYYKMTEKTKSSIRASRQLAIAMRSNKPKNFLKSEKIEAEHIQGVDDQEMCEEGVLELEESKSKIKWTPELVETLRSVFAQQISEQTITVQCVREKVAGIEGLEEMDAREVLQKIRSQWRFPKKQSQRDTSTVEANLPTETETVTQRVNRLFQVDTSSASVISPTIESSSSFNIFSQQHIKLLVEVCEDMLDWHPISKNVISQRLEQNPNAKELLERFTMNQIVNRLKYERRMKKSRR